MVTDCDRLGGEKVMVRETDVTVTDWEGGESDG